MPVIVVGADTPTGGVVLDALLPRQGEIRAFVTDVDTGLALKERGVKVAIGDVSDGSHVGGAALNAFCAVIVTEAAIDGRERSFASDPGAVVAGWREGLIDAGVRRVIVVDHPDVPTGPLRTIAAEFALVDGGTDLVDLAAEVSRLEAAASL